MRRVSSRLLTLALIALLALAGGVSTASASDAGLKKLVSVQRATENRTTAKVRAAGDRVQTANTFPQYRRRISRYVRSLRAIYRQQARSDDRYRARFEAEAPQTSKAKQGRALMLLGLRDDAAALRSIAGRLRSVERLVRRVTSEAAIKRVGTAFDRALRTNVGLQAGSRLKRGRTLIRNAPAVPTPTPAPTGPPAPPAFPTLPTPPATTPPTTPPPTTTTPAQPSLIPGLL